MLENIKEQLMRVNAVNERNTFVEVICCLLECFLVVNIFSIIPQLSKQ